jgi:hypothetical protein
MPAIFTIIEFIWSQRRLDGLDEKRCDVDGRRHGALGTLEELYQHCVSGRQRLRVEPSMFQCLNRETRCKMTSGNIVRTGINQPLMPANEHRADKSIDVQSSPALQTIQNQKKKKQNQTRINHKNKT